MFILGDSLDWETSLFKFMADMVKSCISGMMWMDQHSWKGDMLKLAPLKEWSVANLKCHDILSWNKHYKLTPLPAPPSIISVSVSIADWKLQYIYSFHSIFLLPVLQPHWWHFSKTPMWHHLYSYSLLIDKNICDCQNISIKLPCVCVCLSSKDLFIFW